MNNPYAAEINAVNEYVVNDVISRLNNDPTFDSSIISDLKELWISKVPAMAAKRTRPRSPSLLLDTTDTSNPYLLNLGESLSSLSAPFHVENNNNNDTNNNNNNNSNTSSTTINNNITNFASISTATNSKYVVASTNSVSFTNTTNSNNNNNHNNNTSTSTTRRTATSNVEITRPPQAFNALGVPLATLAPYISTAGAVGVNDNDNDNNNGIGDDNDDDNDDGNNVPAKRVKRLAKVSQLDGITDDDTAFEEEEEAKERATTNRQQNSIVSFSSAPSSIINSMLPLSSSNQQQQLLRRRQQKLRQQEEQAHSIGQFDGIKDDLDKVELGSDDDDDDEVVGAAETADYILCLYTTVKRTRTRRKIDLVDGIMHIQGNEYVFRSAKGEIDFE